MISVRLLAIERCYIYTDVCGQGQPSLTSHEMYKQTNLHRHAAVVHLRTLSSIDSSIHRPMRLDALHSTAAEACTVHT